MPHDLESVASCPIFHRFQPAELATLAMYFDVLSVPPGTVVVREGDPGASMFVVLDGEALLQRRATELRALARGEAFGELALFGGGMRAATVAAQTPMRLARLTHERYLDMAAAHPPIARGFLEAVIARLGRDLVAMTDNIGLLLHERSLPRRARVEVQRGDAVDVVPTGTLLKDLLPPRVGNALVVAGLVDGKPFGLSTPLAADATVAPLTTSTWEGREAYRRSVELLLLEAAHHCAPNVEVRIGSSLSTARLVVVSQTDDLEGLAANIERAMQTLVDGAAPFREEVWSVEEARAHYAEIGWHDAAKLLRVYRSPTVRLSSCGEVYAHSPGPLLAHTGLVEPFRVVPRAPNLVLDYGDVVREQISDAPPLDVAIAREMLAPPYGGDMVRDHHAWLAVLGITSAGSFNDACISGQVTQLIRVSEGFHEKRIGRLADVIVEQEPRVRVICVGGPSSSGKTTFIKRLSVQLQVNGVNPIAVSLDDYYVDRTKTPKDEFGELDFEAFDALDLPLLREQMRALLAGERVKTAKFNFLSGTSMPHGGPELALGPHDVLLLEGIHGLNPALLEGVLDDDLVFRIFIHPATGLPFDRLTRVRPSDLRLLRRIVRDRFKRGYSAADNIRRWASVRRGERKHIFPHLPEADAVFDSSLVYEISVLKVYADRYLLEVPENDPAYTTAYRLRHLIDRFVTIYPEHVPPTSILREFIGGSGFEY
jgi:uridine kinase